MGKIKDLLAEREVTIDRFGRPLSPTALKIIRKGKALDGKSGAKLMKSLQSIVQSLNSFKQEVKNRKAYDLLRSVVKRDFDNAILSLSKMAIDIKNKGIKAVESKNEEALLWEELAICCQDIIKLTK